MGKEYEREEREGRKGRGKGRIYLILIG